MNTPSAGGQAVRKEHNMFTLLFETEAENKKDAYFEASAKGTVLFVK